MILVDANLLLYARDSSSPHHQTAQAWLTDKLNGTVRVGLPWQSLMAFVRIATHPRVYEEPLSATQAWDQVEQWLAAGPPWVPTSTDRHAAVAGQLIRRYDVRGNLVPDADLAALAIEHGLQVYSADTDFARFPEVRWVNPLAGDVGQLS